MNDDEIIEGLNELKRLGILEIKKIKGKEYWQDSALSKKIDKLKPREAFLLGVKQVRKSEREKIEDLFKRILIFFNKQGLIETQELRNEIEEQLEKEK